jgi:hypothetical protein
MKQQQHLHQPSAADNTPKNTLEQQLLQQWDSTATTYDAVFVHKLPSAQDLLTSLSSDVPEITLLANHSAIAAIPAALNQVTSALLRLMLAAEPAAVGQQQQSAERAGHPVDACSSTDAAGGSASNADSGTTKQACNAADTLNAAPLAAQEPGSTAAAAPAADLHDSNVLGITNISACCNISATGQPLPLIPGENFFKLGQEMQALAFILCANIALSILAASFAPFLVR